MNPRPNEAQALATGYTAGHRAYELGGVAVGAICGAWLGWRLLSGPGIHAIAAVAAIIGGMLIADSTSGAVHWMFDTWGSVKTPVVGALAIRTFREHHLDPRSMLRHDFIETNGHNCALSVVLSVSGLCSARPATALMFLSGAFFIGITSQIHKWAHMERAPLAVRLLQRMRVILPPEHHQEHHQAPHICNYCITLGWLDGPLRGLRAWEALEAVISRATGAVPRG